MVENIASTSADICSDNDFENESLLKLYLNPKSMYSKNGDSQKNSLSESLEKEQITKKIEQLSYLDLQKSEEDELKYLINFSLKYNGTIYQTPSFANLSLTDQVKVLCSYHTKISKNISYQAKLQLECAPLPKLIKTPVNCPNFTLNDVEMDMAEEEPRDNNINSFDTLLNSSSRDYISKSGRITKRKFYSETDDAEMKKPKIQDGDWINCKKPSPTSKGSGRGKKLLFESGGNDLDNKSISKKNAETISRSILFKEKDSPKNDRWSKIEKGLQLQKSKNEKEEAELKQFNKTLSNSEEIIDNSPIRRRVKPPSLKSKVGNVKKEKEQYAELELTTQKAQVEKPSNVKSRTQKKASGTLKNEISASTSNSVQKATENMIQCPICSRDFKSTEIEEHASSCGENRMETRSNPPMTMTCRFCDAVFLHDREYEEHVKSCNKRSFK